MLTELSVTNFKSWKQISRMRLAPITGLFGTNSSGKTSILQLLLMLKQTAESADRAQSLALGDEKSLVDLGSFSEVVFAHADANTVAWRIGWDYSRLYSLTGPDDVSHPLFLGRQMAHEADISQGRMGRPVVDRMAYEFAEMKGPIRFALTRKPDVGSPHRLESEGLGFKFEPVSGRSLDLPAPVKCYGFPDQVKAAYRNAGFLADLELAFEELFGRLHYLGPLRDPPRRAYPWAGAQPTDMGRRGERVVDALLATREAEADDEGEPSPELHVARWLQKLGMLHEFRVEPIAKGENYYKVLVRKNPQSAEVLLPDVGFGVSQILPVITLCYYVPEGSTILLEQPEIHLHPSVQAGLADVFIDAAEKRNVQIIVESHSEHLLRRLQRRMAEGKTTPERTALYFCEMSDGESHLRELDIDRYGRIANWPDGFFGDEFEEMAATVTEAIKRQAEGR
ncbi:MAG TPA: DUF3696 domain-containing protein [Phycisphaerae bacterium]|nr:DUF3696 domain-containing protein [Phycisphaerae bacterium]